VSNASDLRHAETAPEASTGRRLYRACAPALVPLAILAALSMAVAINANWIAEMTNWSSSFAVRHPQLSQVQPAH